ncbi:isoleucyl-tRNA synthetase [Candidatus Carsonella ruddii HT isolate Thao2000]|uniref:isoleucine--tRNA ligase n=1 Tax=Candidatus Carsonella ruddii HT isolate Thao2000 TaxID=1202539 RepID=J3VQD8_CARRU|nr:class I tRNA ligase family protein [Candidatus Carsonella ruddii]AFP84176.1 isoleucyl-tRNA synthetase [Candidatus Carsonella ruddii HT isolate Thao2000]
MLNLPKKIYFMKADIKNKNFFINNYYLLNNKIINIFLLDGPPFANGEFHIGHVLNKTIKDILIKNFYINNYLLLSNNGSDSHGLPIEQLNKNYNFFYLNCRNIVCNNIFLQKKNLKTFLLINNFFKYNTMEPRYESLQYKIFNYLIIKNIVKINKIPILWCFKCISSLSYSEILYKKINSFSYYIKIKFEFYFILIWTTTLWSLINNQAIFFKNNEIYVIFKTKKNFLIFSKKIFYQITKKLKLKGKIYSFLIGNFFYKKKYKLFLKKILNYYNKKHVFLNNNFIDFNIGTGFIHCSPSNGIEDYEIYNKKKINNFFDKKYFIKHLILLKNLNLFFYNKIIYNYLKKRKVLFLKNKIIHNCMFCWRHKKPIFFYLSEQIFINLNFFFKNKNIKNILINYIKKINFFPKFIKKNLVKMIYNRSNWCISRQRYWGVPIILNYFKISLYKNITKTFSSHIIFYLEKKYNIFDVWLDSSIISILFKNKIVIEGKDQIRGWFQCIIIINFFIFFKINIKKIILHNFCVDKNGNKLSKSSKNFKSLSFILKNNSSEILKLYLLEHDFKKNIVFDNDNIKNSSFTYIIIRNFIKFLINNFYDFNFKKIFFLFFDYWIIFKKNIIETKIKKTLLVFNFYNAIKIIKLFINFINLNYFNYLKNNIYICKKNSYIRNSGLFTIFNILSFLKKNLFPLLFFTSKELSINILNLYLIKKNFSFFLKIKNFINSEIFFFKKFSLLKKIKNNFFLKKIFFLNFYWNWFLNNFYYKKKNKKIYCYLSKNYINKKNFFSNKKVCNFCLINIFHNCEEIKFYA